MIFNSLENFRLREEKSTLMKSPCQACQLESASKISRHLFEGYFCSLRNPEILLMLFQGFRDPYFNGDG